MHDNSFDRTVAVAWRIFQSTLTERLRAFTDGDFFEIVPNPGFSSASWRISVTLTKAGRIRLSLYPAGLDAADAARQITILEQIGWRGLRDGSFIAERGPAHAAQLAEIAAQTMREVWDIVHPTFLLTPDSAADEAPVEATLRLGPVVESPAHLRALVVAALEEVADAPVRLDEDGDIPVPTRPRRSWLHIHDDAPRIELFTMLTDDVPDVALAAEVIAAQPTAHPTIRLMIRDGKVFAQSVFDARVFHFENLSAAMADWFTFVAEDTPGIVEQISGTLSGTDSDAELPEALLTMLQLDPDNISLTPEQVARICGHDRADILRYIRTCEEQSLSWSQSADEAADPDEAAACQQEDEAWRATAEKLRAALRLVVLPDDGGAHDMRAAG